MWFKWFKNYPVRYKIVGLALIYCLGILGFLAGMIFWIVSGCRNIQALILALTGAGVFAFFYWLARASASFEGPDDEPADEPEDC
ncbi:MAG: hypothetical protein IJL62_03665 [Clostridia bacterium]|nr:hypothetical protein [Clostridia bacterium]